MRYIVILVLLLLTLGFYGVSYAAEAQKNLGIDILASLKKQNALLSAQSEYLALIFVSMCIAQKNKSDYCLKIVRDINQRNKVAHVAPQKTSQWHIDKANCELYARQNARGVSGSPVLQMLTRSGEVQALMEACMKSKGYKIAKERAGEEQKQDDN